MKNSELTANFERLEAVMRAGFHRMDARFDQVDARLDAIDGRLDRLEAKIHHLRDTTAENFEVLEVRLNERLDRLEQRV